MSITIFNLFQNWLNNSLNFLKMRFNLSPAISRIMHLLELELQILMQLNQCYCDFIIVKHELKA